MSKFESIYKDWNPWHGCTKISPGCKYCYVYRQDEMYGGISDSSVCHKNSSFDLPIRKNRKGDYKIPSGKIIFTCFTSDFLLKDADEWREDCWKMIGQRRDCWFYFFTKRIDRTQFPFCETRSSEDPCGLDKISVAVPGLVPCI